MTVVPITSTAAAEFAMYTKPWPFWMNRQLCLHGWVEANIHG